MIADTCFSAEWQVRKREELGGCDPVLLEKTIHAFALLDALAARGLEFVFKGGTSLLLRLPRIRRLSIDADILCHEPPEKLAALLREVSRIFGKLKAVPEAMWFWSEAIWLREASTTPAPETKAGDNSARHR